MTADERFAQAALELGHRFDGEIKIGGNYSPVVRDGQQLFVSGQIPRVGDEVLYVGTVGSGIDLASARTAAAICAMRALAFVQRAAGSLDAVRAVARITVYVRSAPDFTQQSEVADGASDLIARVLGPVGAHTRTSVGVLQLPKGAAVELDLIARVD
ncbi:yjgF/chorismate mutase-like, endoribonuclease family protein [Delftia acidovorans]|uniref:RidA family protein n=1 Tax=Delftia acidovorans TaxID=80866 RepID=UPI0005052AA5|nr:RidA family protein [Delftia acidovorans]KFJ14212.1 yjgF/chorismate mutase-like, endoribonuclease family protein [Delftia acidovorans]QQB49521.1 RidA family protein [Delftia acidovorans]